MRMMPSPPVPLPTMLASLSTRSYADRLYLRLMYDAAGQATAAISQTAQVVLEAEGVIVDTVLAGMGTASCLLFTGGDWRTLMPGEPAP